MEIALHQRLYTHLTIDFSCSKPCIKGRHIQQQLLLQNTLGVRRKLFSLLTFLPLPWPASLTSDVPVSTHFGLAISVLSLNVLDYPLILKREPLKYQFCLCKLGWIFVESGLLLDLMCIFSIWPPFLQGSFLPIA